MKLFFGVLLALPVVSVAQQAGSPQFTLTGKVQGLPENSRVALTDGSNPTDTVAEARVKNGEFVLKGHVSEPNLYEVNFDAAKKKTPLFMGDDRMQLSGSVDDLAGLKTAGSPSNDDFVAFQAEFTPYFKELNALGAKVNAMEFVAKHDSLMTRIKQVSDSIFIVLDQFIKAK